MEGTPSTEEVTATAVAIQDEYVEIMRVMRIIEGEDFESDLPDDMDMKFRGTEDGDMPIAWFRFGGDLVFSREPATGRVVEMRREGERMRVRSFAPDGAQVSDRLDALPSPSPDLN